MPISALAANGFVKRHAEAAVRTALADTRIVAVVGPRQSGKSTLAHRIAADDGRTYVSLDDEQNRQLALNDPTGFLRDMPHAAIDEIQRAPNLLLAIKQAVDQCPAPGRYLITGSVDLFGSLVSPDSLAGRVETIQLLPFSQAEIAEASPPRFLERAFANDFPGFEHTGRTDNFIERVLAGGYPEALSRSTPKRRRSWLGAYAESLASRDVRDIAAVNKIGELPSLLNVAALVSGQLLNMSALGGSLNIDSKTAKRWISLLEHMFVMRRLRSWHSNRLKRLIKMPKIQFLDSGLLASLRHADEMAITGNRQLLGPLAESFVYGEVAKAVALSERPVSVSHYRNKDGIEVDFVLERSPGSIVGIEVKASATALPGDFLGLRHLRNHLGDQFMCGILLHDGDRIQQASDRLTAMPVKMLWEA